MNVKKLGLALMVFPALFSVAVALPPKPAQPNLLFILTDDLDFAEVAFMPYVNRLIKAQGVSFENYFASASLCCPSRATTLRGQYAHNTGVLNNGEGSDQRGGFAAAQKNGLEASNLGAWLQAGGYHTALIGKYLNGYPGSNKLTYVPPGWTTWISPSAGTPYSNYDYTLNENGQLQGYGNQPKDYGTDVYAAKTVEVIRQSAAVKQPFFIYFAPLAPHVPDIPAVRHLGLFPEAKVPRNAAYNEQDVSDKPAFVRSRPLMSPTLQEEIDELYRRRLQTLQAVDEAVAQFVRVLRETGQLDHTYIIFTSDNGYHLGQHRLPAGKRAAYETDIHLPLFVRGPGVPKNVVRSTIFGNVDLAPTIAELAGVTPPAFVDGRSFRPFLQAKPPAVKTRAAYLLEHWGEGKPLPEKELKGINEPRDHDRYTAPAKAHPFILKNIVPKGLRLPGVLPEAREIPNFSGLRTPRYTYVSYKTGEQELYDLRRDPLQLSNLATSSNPAPPTQLLKRLNERTRQLASCKASVCRALENQPLTP